VGSNSVLSAEEARRVPSVQLIEPTIPRFKKLYDTAYIVLAFEGIFLGLREVGSYVYRYRTS
jgi:hypothetical protein